VRPSGEDAGILGVDSGSLDPGPDADARAADSGIEAASDHDAGHPVVDSGAADASTEAAPPSGPGPYGADGPSPISTATFQLTSPAATFTTTAYFPSDATPHPVVVLSSGFFQPAAAYVPYAHRLASWGIVTLLRDDPNLGESTTNVVSDVEYTVATWLAQTDADSTSALHGKIDMTKVGLAGHSRGGQVALLAAEGLQGKLQGVFGLDPVDTAMSGQPQARTMLPGIGVPVAFIGETTDSAASGCAPGTDNFQVLFLAASSPAVAITAVNADHTMFEDPASCSFCTLCTKGTASQPLVLATAVRYLTAFFARQLLGDATVGATFDGAGALQDVAAGTVQLESK
jgi:dienelactone hydrolase